MGARLSVALCLAAACGPPDLGWFDEQHLMLEDLGVNAAGITIALAIEPGALIECGPDCPPVFQGTAHAYRWDGHSWQDFESGWTTWGGETLGVGVLRASHEHLER